MILERKNSISLAIFLVILIAISYFVIKPLTDKTFQKYKESLDKKAQLEQLKSELAELEKTETQLKNKQSKINKVLNYLPLSNTNNFVTQTEGLAAKGGNQLNSIKCGEPQKGSDQKKLANVAGTKENKFEITIIGNYSSAYNFLSGLEKLTQFNNVYTLSINLSENKVTAIIGGASYNRGGQ